MAEAKQIWAVRPEAGTSSLLFRYNVRHLAQVERVRGRGCLLKLEIMYVTDVGCSLCQCVRQSPVTVHKTKALSPRALLNYSLALQR